MKQRKFLFSFFLFLLILVSYAYAETQTYFNETFNNCIGFDYPSTFGVINCTHKWDCLIDDGSANNYCKNVSNQLEIRDYRSPVGMSYVSLNSTNELNPNKTYTYSFKCNTYNTDESNCGNGNELQFYLGSIENPNMIRIMLADSTAGNVWEGNPYTFNYMNFSQTRCSCNANKSATGLIQVNTKTLENLGVPLTNLSQINKLTFGYQLSTDTFYLDLKDLNVEEYENQGYMYSFNIEEDVICLDNETDLATATLLINTTNDAYYTPYYYLKLTKSFENEYFYKTSFVDQTPSGCECSDFFTSNNFVTQYSFKCEDTFQIYTHSLDSYWNGDSCTGEMETKVNMLTENSSNTNRSFFIVPDYTLISDSDTNIQFRLSTNKVNLSIIFYDTSFNELLRVNFSLYDSLTIKTNGIDSTTDYPFRTILDLNNNIITVNINHNMSNNSSDLMIGHPVNDTYYEINTNLTLNDYWKNFAFVEFKSQHDKENLVYSSKWKLRELSIRSFAYNFNPMWTTTKPLTYSFNNTQLGYNSLTLYITDSNSYPTILFNYTDYITVFDSDSTQCRYVSNTTFTPIQEMTKGYYEVLDFQEKLDYVYFLLLFIVLVIVIIFIRNFSISLILTSIPFIIFSYIFDLGLQFIVTPVLMFVLGLAIIFAGGF